ncbi:hypothetical protein [Spirillospora sp. CA-294931]|uniref:hypothetical protein n=1 Tax=Spirillospora sp. CA-294931 TaxID=3240042 RepID=UPI003D8AAE6E
MRESGALLAWCLVANVAPEVPFRPETRRVSRPFAPSAKVWILPPRWGDGNDEVIVVGRQKGSRRYVRTVLPRRRLTGFRVRGVYSPAVLRRLTDPLADGRPAALWRTREEAEQTAATWAEPRLPVRLADGESVRRLVPDPPPLEIVERGHTYYLTAVDPDQAIYSPTPPDSPWPL